MQSETQSSRAGLALPHFFSIFLQQGLKSSPVATETELAGT
jgi:hypothetical protein